MDSQAGYTLLSEEPVIVEDLRTEERFSGPELLANHDVVSGISVVIGSVEEPWGVLGTHTTARREFTEHDAAFVQSIANVLASAIENEAAQKDLKEFYERISDAFFAIDEEWRFTYLNDRAHEWINPEDRKLVGKNIWEEFPAATEREFKPKYEQAMYEQETVSFEEYYPDPLDAWFEVRAYPSETGLSVYFRDVTERKERENELAETVTELRESEERLRLALEAGEMGTWELDLQTTDSPARSPQHDRIFGYEEPLDEWDFETFLEHVHPDDRERVRQCFEDAFETGTWEFECRITRADDEQRVVSARGEFHSDNEGEPVRAVGVVQDVTERKRREQQLAESEQRYRTLARCFPNGIVTLFDDDLRYTLAAGRAFDEFPLSREEVEGYHPREVWGDDITDALEPALTAALNGEERSVEVEYEEREWRLHAVPVTDDADNVIAGMTMSQDITEHKRRERQLRRQQQYTTDVLDAIEDVFYVIGEDAELNRWNQSLIEVSGYTTEEIESMVLTDFFAEDDREQALDVINEGFETGSVNMELDLRTKDGDTIPFEFFASTLEDQAGNTVLAGIGRDITERVERDRELERALDLLEKTERIADVGGWEIDVETQDVFWTDHIFDLLEVPGDKEPPLEEALAMYHEEDQPVVEEAVTNALDSGEPFDIEVRIRTDSGDIRWLRLQGVPEIVDDEVVSFRGTAQDVTERKARERALKDAKSQLETLFDVLPVGVVVAEANGELLEANGTAHEIWGGDVFDANSVAEYDQYPVFDADTGERIPPEEMTLTKVLRGEEVTDPDIYEFHAVDGERRIVELEGMPIRDGAGEVVRGVITMSDVTERWEAQRNLEESERRYRTLVENFPNGSVGLFNEELEYTAVGGELVEQFGIDSEERIGHSIRELHPPDLLSEVEPHFEATFEGETNSFEVEFHGRHLHATTLPVRNADDEVFAGMLVVQDVTERREYERKLEESNERLEQFAYAASHDLQEPLRMVSSYLSLIERRYADELDEDGEEFIEFAVDGADRMRGMIEGLLEYSRIETQGDPFKPIDLETVLADVRADLQVKIEENDADLTVEELPHVEGDANQLRQVFQNLLENAIEYSGDDPPRIRVAAERDGAEWILSVQDEGIGIDPTHADSIFQVFERLHTNDEHEGTGIGLALCERIVERHGGDIWVESEPDEGATFSFTLPATDA